jgi:hypothetical protein
VVVVAGAAVVVVVATRTQAMSVDTFTSISVLFVSISVLMSGVRSAYDVITDRVLAGKPNNCHVFCLSVVIDLYSTSTRT